MQAPFGLMALPACIVGSSGVVGALALAGTVMLIRRGGALGWTIGILAALIAIAGLGFVAYALWGRYVGYPWTFAAMAQ